MTRYKLLWIFFLGINSLLMAQTRDINAEKTAIMDECGSSFSHNEAKSPESSLVGGPIQENKVKCALANPMTYVSAKTPPFLIFHGDKDNLVPHCQSEKLYETLQKDGVQSELVIVPGGQHGPGVMEAGYYARMVDFFKKELKKK